MVGLEFPSWINYNPFNISVFKMILLAKDLFPNEFKRCPQFMSNHKNIIIDQETLQAANIQVDTVIQKPGDYKTNSDF
jgi:hypothetical protein